MNLTALLAIVGLGVAGYYSGKGGIKVGNRVEDRRRTAVRLGSWCSANGLPDLAGLLTEYAVQNYTGVFHQFQTISDKIANPAEAQQALDQFLQVQLDAKLKTAEGQDSLIKYVERALNIQIDRESIIQLPPSLVKREV